MEQISYFLVAALFCRHIDAHHIAPKIFSKESKGFG
jgi:hypothetical protein